jgi:hypothetical protein
MGNGYAKAKEFLGFARVGKPPNRISEKLEHLRRRRPPSRKHGRQILKARKAFFVGNLEIEKRFPQKDSDSREKALQARMDCHRAEFAPLEKGMAEKGVALRFLPRENAIFYGDVLSEGNICGCPVTFIANTNFYRGQSSSLPGILQSRVPTALCTLGSDGLPDGIFIFADIVGRTAQYHLSFAANPPRKIMGLGFVLHEHSEAGLPYSMYSSRIAQGVARMDALSEFCDLLYCRSVEGEVPGAFTDKLVFTFLMHELGHLFFRRKAQSRSFPERMDELFAESFSITPHGCPRFNLADIVNMATLSTSGVGGCHTDSAGIFMGRFNRAIGERADFEGFINAFPRYIGIGAREILNISLDTLSHIASRLGASFWEFRERAMDEAKKAVFG